ncbi:MAG: lysophospholipid acyltransferase family protein [Betaproteobacteria bacterium]|jgi:KDO2-lipid IV(A) lauroyltransferase|nr:lysophospholipid acyltransferase family protein [Rhodocyclaceae bacterium]MCA3134123.1 lysophospholipid acyltransferase family protein [Rhodocyclaceae bacterium]MCA3142585.1 lysophospholipid acyltransferase family protein [Rhodocyclaceae bacterium]MCA3144334.1 lysophospholipid acyltransferase family protein [Rhodocyclaceae bacterium]MCE2897398.1 lysophospholipid acyltransferase family protein [Betaproteobacteria bacterium]
MTTLAVRALLSLMWLLHFLPVRLLAPLGAGAGMLLFALSAERRHVARTNLRLCFPDRSDQWHERVLRAHFRCFGRSLLESSIAWFGSPARLRQVVRVEGLEHLHNAAEKGFIGLVPHFCPLDLEGIRMTLEFRGMAVYAHQKNRYFDTFLQRVRSRFNGTRMVARQEGVKAIIRGMRAGYALQLSPDMDLGARDALFVPFFGVPAATVTVLSRLARLTGAAVVPLVIRQEPDGYRIRVHPPWRDYPGSDVETDTRRMNAFIEQCVLEAPEQYLWLHKRFKTRPDGEARFY